jgi:hypothetical protein
MGRRRQERGYTAQISDDGFLAWTTQRWANLRLLAEGTDDYLTKALDVKNLLRLLEQIVHTGPIS